MASQVWGIVGLRPSKIQNLQFRDYVLTSSGGPKSRRSNEAYAPRRFLRVACPVNLRGWLRSGQLRNTASNTPFVTSAHFLLAFSQGRACEKRTVSHEFFGRAR